MEIGGHAGVEAGSQCVLFRYCLSPLWPKDENLVIEGVLVLILGGLFGGKRYGVDAVAVVSVARDRIEYLGYQMMLVMV